MSLKWQTAEQLEKEFVKFANQLMQTQGYWVSCGDTDMEANSIFHWREPQFGKKYPCKVIAKTTYHDMMRQNELLGDDPLDCIDKKFYFRLIKLD